MVCSFIINALKDNNVEVRGCETTQDLVSDIIPAKEDPNPSERTEQLNWDDPSPLSQYALTQILKSIDNTPLRNLAPKRSFTSIQFDLKNSYPKWVNNLKLWGQG